MDRLYQNIKKYAQNNQIRWRQHALSRMLERDITRDEIRSIIEHGEIIEHYPESEPYPGCLILGYATAKPLHAVITIDTENEFVYIVTAYIPDDLHFQSDLKTRKRGNNGQ